MRIAQVAPLYESVPPRCYGGTERVVSYLTEELVRQGHQVTLFASGDSVTRARLCAPCARSLRTDTQCRDPNAYHLLMLERVFQEAGEFDIIHFHTDYQHFPLSRRHDTAVVHTHHGRLDLPDLFPVFQEFREIPSVSISNNQRGPLPWLNWQATVYHGLPKSLHSLRENPGSYLAFLGRISPEKGIEPAIEIARRFGMPLKVAAKIDKNDVDYYESIKPLLHEPFVEFIGEVGGSAKDEFLGNAYAMLFPIDWPEPFGLVMIEAMACGTPTIAYPLGSVPEVLEDGVTGFIVNDVADAVDALDRVDTLSRLKIRKVFDTRFSTQRMADDYLSVYQALTLGQARARAVAL